MTWPPDINLDKYIATSAPYGGPIAIRRDDQKFIKIQGAGGQPFIAIFSGSGKEIASFKVGLFFILFQFYNKCHFSGPKNPLFVWAGQTMKN